ncbi:MAG TPA: DUF721 domain-containing protein [Smithellaceae bacterium]|nr:DUF721 domain-containing protein [Smithellaceae bacterium]
MRRKNSHTGLQSIGDILGAALKRKGLASQVEENALLKLWPEAVGRQIAAKTQADCLKNGTLFVRTTSSIWVQQMHFVKEEILRKLNELAGKKKEIKDIRFTVGYKPVACQEITPDYHPGKQFLKERDKRMIASCTDTLRDTELGKILARVMTLEIARRREMEKKQVQKK